MKKKTEPKKYNLPKEVPHGWRLGQFLFNFLEYLAVEKGIHPNQSYRLADTFHLSDEELIEYYEEYLKTFKN